MTRLAELLYMYGQVEEAYKYISQSMDDAIFYGAKQRKSEVGAILPVIAASRLNYIDNQRKTLLGLFYRSDHPLCSYHHFCIEYAFSIPKAEEAGSGNTTDQ